MGRRGEIARKGARGARSVCRCRKEGEMSNTEKRSFRSIAREAKARLKSGFWQNCKSELSGEVARAKESGISESRAGRYFAGKVTCSIRGGEDDAFYEKVRALLMAEGEVSDAIGRLTDHEVFDKLSYEDKQRYTLALSERYLRALERYRREREFEK